jgi:hypothetical protein
MNLVVAVTVKVPTVFVSDQPKHRKVWVIVLFVRQCFAGVLVADGLPGGCFR